MQPQVEPSSRARISSFNAHIIAYISIQVPDATGAQVVDDMLDRNLDPFGPLAAARASVSLRISLT